MSAKKLTARVSRVQKAELVEHMRQNLALARGQFAGPDSSKKNKVKWEEIAVALNAVGGAKKNAEQWKRCWIDWKGAIKQKYAALKVFSKRTGNLPSSAGPKPLDSLEEDVVHNILVPDTYEGDSGTIEGGFDLEKPEVETEFLEEEFLEGELIEAYPTNNTPSKKRKSLDTTPNKPKKQFLLSELETAKKDMEARLCRQESNMEVLKTELREIKEGQKRTNELLQNILEALNKTK